MSASMAKSGALLFKTEGNEAFEAGDYAGALQSYNDGVEALRCYTASEDELGAGCSEPELLTVLLSNKAEALLRLGRVGEALRAADEVSGRRGSPPPPSPCAAQR